jgi:hypothetical protein
MNKEATFKLKKCTKNAFGNFLYHIMEYILVNFIIASVQLFYKGNKILCFYVCVFPLLQLLKHLTDFYLNFVRLRLRSCSVY